MGDERHGIRQRFLERWSLRKARGARDRSVATSSRDVEPSTTPAAFDIGALDFSSDYSGFLLPHSSDAAHVAGLRHLWTTSGLFGFEDGLDVYRGDYSCAACSLTSGDTTPDVKVS